MRRSTLLIALVVAFIAGGKVLLENVLGLNLEGMAREWLASARLETAVIIMTLLAADVFLPVPSSLVMVLSGAAFGTLPGAAIALAGSVGGEWLGFELVRRFGRRMSSRLVGDDEVKRLDGFFARHGALAIVVTRPLPIVMETMSIIAGLSKMPRGTFLAASLVGTAPIVLVYAHAGAVSRATGSLLPALVMLLALSGLSWLAYRTRFERA